MKKATIALLACAAVLYPAVAGALMDGSVRGRDSGERFPAVTIVAGEGVAANVSNVLLPPPGVQPVAPCPVAVSFLAGDGTPIGATQSLSLLPGASAAVPASSPAPGLVRAVVSISDVSRAQFCALKTDLEIFDAKTGATRLVVPSDTCVGLGLCAVPLK